MIITVSKPFPEITKNLSLYRRVFIVGCASCATKCQTGDDDALKNAALLLEKEGKEISGYLVLDTPCDIRIVRRDLGHSPQVASCDVILVLACGSAVGAIEKVVDKPIIPGLDPLFVGTTERIGVYHEFCTICGKCILDKTAGICPRSRCPKGLVNGPCGGIVNGKCETDTDRDCAWVLIYNKMKRSGREKEIVEGYHAPKSYSKPYLLNRSSLHKVKQ